MKLDSVNTGYQSVSEFRLSKCKLYDFRLSKCKLYDFRLSKCKLYYDFRLSKYRPSIQQRTSLGTAKRTKVLFVTVVIKVGD